MSYQRTPRGFRLHIAFLGRRNAGKSSLLNALTKQDVSIVSETPGTTTDPVFKSMEVQPLGPVTFIDTPGGDDVGGLGGMRVGKMRRALDRADLAVLAAPAGGWGDFEDGMLEELRKRGTPTVVVMTKCDLAEPDAALLERLDVPVVRAALPPDGQGRGDGLPDLKQALLELTPEESRRRPTILGDLVPPGAMVVLVMPIDAEAPAGRLILPQVQALRDLLDHHCHALVCQHTELEDALAMLREPPALVVTDSQAFAEVDAVVPDDVVLTSFSILFARLKGDLESLAIGALAIDRLKPGDRVLIAESCTHHAVDDDIGTVKIPRLLTKRAGGELEIVNHQGHDFPDDLAAFDLVVHCGACMTNRREVLSRLGHCADAGAPATNYGTAIAHCLGILDRTLAPFPELRERWREARDGLA